MSLEPSNCRTDDRGPSGCSNPVQAPQPEIIQFIVEPITLTSQGITYRTERTTLAARRVSGAATSASPEVGGSGPAERSIAAKVLDLLTALDPDERLRTAPPIKVFNLYYRKRLRITEIARICDCHRSVVYDRLTSIRDKLPWTPAQLHEVSPQVEAMEEALNDSKARGIYRKGAVYGDDRDEPGDN